MRDYADIALELSRGAENARIAGDQVAMIALLTASAQYAQLARLNEKTDAILQARKDTE